MRSRASSLTDPNPFQDFSACGALFFFCGDPTSYERTSFVVADYTVVDETEFCATLSQECNLNNVIRLLTHRMISSCCGNAVANAPNPRPIAILRYAGRHTWKKPRAMVPMITSPMKNVEEIGTVLRQLQYWSSQIDQVSERIASRARHSTSKTGSAGFSFHPFHLLHICYTPRSPPLSGLVYHYPDT